MNKIGMKSMIIGSYTIVYMLNPTGYTVKLGELGKPSEDTGYKIHVQKLFAFLYTKNNIRN